MSRPPKGKKKQSAPPSKDNQFDLKDWPFYWLAKANNQYISNLEQALKQIDLDVPSWRALMLIDEEEPKSISYLASEAIVKMSTMTRIIKRMEVDGLVNTQPRATDQRVTEVSLSNHGKRARILAFQQADGIYRSTFHGMAPEDVQSLNRILSAIHQNLTDSAAIDRAPSRK